MKNEFGFEENKYGNIDCFDLKTNTSKIPDGFVITKLTKPQLKMLKIPTMKGMIGFIRTKYRRGGVNPASPILVNLIKVEDEPKAIEYQQKIYMKKGME